MTRLELRTKQELKDIYIYIYIHMYIYIYVYIYTVDILFEAYFMELLAKLVKSF